MRYYAEEKPSLEGLSHYGVQGMKWGVRKSEAQLAEERFVRSTESRKLRSKSATTLRKYMYDSIKNDPWFRVMTKEEYDSLSNKGRTFAQNTTLKRIATEEHAKLEGATFVSKLNSDANFYKAALPAVGPNAKGFGGGRKKYKQENYEIEMKTVKKLSLPSDKQRVDAFIEILGKPIIKIPGKDAPITGRQFLEQNGYKYVFRKKTDQEAAFLAYYDFVKGQGNKDSPLNEAYFKSLRRKGFNAIDDENDRGRYAKSPLIILNPNGTVKQTGIRRLTADEINEAQRKLGKRKEVMMSHVSDWLTTEARMERIYRPR